MQRWVLLFRLTARQEPRAVHPACIEGAHVLPLAFTRGAATSSQVVIGSALAGSWCNAKQKEGGCGIPQTYYVLVGAGSTKGQEHRATSMHVEQSRMQNKQRSNGAG